MRISRNKATNMARQIAKPLREKIKELDKQIQTTGRAFALSSIPQEVIEVYKKYPAYFPSWAYVYIKGIGLSSSLAIDADELPLADSSLTVSPMEAKVLCKLVSKLEDANAKYDDTVLAIETALYNLGTYKKILAEFPELKEFMPQDNPHTGIAIPFEPLHKALKDLIAQAKVVGQ